MGIHRPGTLFESFFHPVQVVVTETFAFRKPAAEDNESRIKDADEIGDPVSQDLSLLAKDGNRQFVTVLSKVTKAESFFLNGATIVERMIGVFRLFQFQANPAAQCDK